MSAYKKFRKVLSRSCQLIRTFVVLKYRRRIPLLERRLKEKQQIKVVFFVMSLSMWKGDRLFQLMRESKRFRPFAVFAPRIDMPVEEKEKERERLKLHFQSMGVIMIDGYNCITDTGIDIKKKIDPDIVFYTLPYSSVTQRSYSVCRSYWHNRFPDALICFFPYSFPITDDKQGYTSLLIDLAWKLFYPTNFHKKLAERLAMTKGKNMIITGYPSADVFLDKTRRVSDAWKTSSSILKRIIWAPHHTVDADRLQFSTFIMYADYMQQIAKKYQDKIQIAFKPHPLLRPKLYKHPDWGVERTNAYYDAWTKMPNTILAEGDYIDLFLTSDAMIHDSGSFMVEYLYTQKPVMYLTRPGHLNKVSELGKMALDVHYKGGSESDIEAFIENVVLGNDDAMCTSREHFFNEWLLPPHNKTVAQNILDEIAKYF